MSEKYKGFWVSVTTVYESTESRLARGDWQSRVLGYKYTVRRNGKLLFSLDENARPLPPTHEEAIDDFQHRVDTILESL
ncbi:MAG: hypothetical protein V7K22_13000 [Nostoc sp.]|uniref:hypothetical protein n=1 Tax=Nostoc sp. TaxID=1180 RepID=UPI002FF70705